MGNSRGIVLSHKADLDGVTSALIAREAMKRKYSLADTDIDVRFAHYAEITLALQQIAQDAPEFVYITDLSFSSDEHVAALREVTDQEAGRVVRVFDHHASSREALAGKDLGVEIVLVDDGTKCAADLIYDHLMEVWALEKDGTSVDLHYWQALAELKDCAHSRDLWIRNIVQGDELTYMIDTLGAERVYNQLLEEPQRVFCYSELMRFGLELARENEKRSYGLAEQSMYVQNLYLPDLNERLSIIACLTSGFESQIGHTFIDAQNPRLCVMLDTRKLAISLRANEAFIRLTGVTAADIAREYGGGGHPPAAGMPDRGFAQRGTVDLAMAIYSTLSAKLRQNNIKAVVVASGAGKAMLAMNNYR